MLSSLGVYTLNSGSTNSGEAQNKVSGHQAIDWYEAFADGLVGEGERQSAWWYFHLAEYMADGPRYQDDEPGKPPLALRYGVGCWLCHLESRDSKTTLINTIDYHLARDTGDFYTWASRMPHHCHYFDVAKALIADIFGNPFRPVVFDPGWRSESAVALARTAYETRDFSLLPILADALEEAGCDHPDVLTHCRGDGPHVRGCWVLDGVLGRV